MKKLLAASVLVFSSMSVMAAPQSNQGGFSGPHETAPLTQAQGGFNGPSAIPVLNTVKAASQADDNAVVELTGHIISSIGKEDYMFKDGTGEIKVEIDNKDWHGITVTPTTEITLRGEVDKDWTVRTIDVNTVTLAK
ncbi:YgiW/YdeI family stress tolerance OB fold protein [Photobacterium iliopiscarium]|uniref:YgiW/YdeI family stress tolerance OB fold protein n=1 Tax=Photobacterium iliopiscarium TaxID=56192 RepID=UPI001E62488C|nr:NirD/YgiW/YdeI family stress tolerance protein [Photobacterium iliopiscarium]MCD9466001.1 TIGR00156 family protein [Photobacterium iliopiscarium]MCD9486562.1 NirD/YgiW/YdeI family stress tolerance protein [Photobacterium iliopiscarium]MCF2243079.1 NirD/YgiW/YdeI family stress tolerance protein [Photobacterium iliopiscarium]